MEQPGEVPFRETLQRDLARASANLPMLPRAASEALALARSPSPDLLRLGDLVTREPALAARLLSIANSALYCRGNSVASVRQAVLRLGPEATRDVLYQSVYGTVLFDAVGFRERVDSAFVRGVAGGRLARRLCTSFGVEPDTAYLCGLLRDIGEARCWRLAARRRPQGHREEDVLDAIAELHGAAGAELIRAWKLPLEAAEACLGHHSDNGSAVSRLVFLSDQLVEVAAGRLSQACVDDSNVGSLEPLLVDAREILAGADRRPEA